jgi:mRNA-degrading endonuclease YafQ of YafQ-DinJ toxin-antitoxin module
MAYFIFTKNLENAEGSLYRFAENKIDLDNLNIDVSCYTVIEDNQINFNEIKNGNRAVLNYSNNKINFTDSNTFFIQKKDLESIINKLKKQIKEFTDNNINHSLYSRWNSYHNQLNDLNLDNISYPLNKSLEQYFSDLGQPSYNILQLP